MLKDYSTRPDVFEASEILSMSIKFIKALLQDIFNKNIKYLIVVCLTYVFHLCHFKDAVCNI